MNLYKIKGVKYVMLEAAGGSDLINLYKHYGFKIILSTYKHYGQTSTNSIMLGNIDTIIKNTQVV